MKPWGVIVIGGILYSSAAFATPQPCAEATMMWSQMQGMPIQMVEDEFHKSGYRNALDPRVLAATAIIYGGGNSLCGPLHDPFHGPGLDFCNYYPSFRVAIQEESDYIGHKYIADNNAALQTIVDGEGWLNPGGGLIKMFNFLFGDSRRLVYYSTSCCGDCDRNYNVDINELIEGVLIAGLNGPPLSNCPMADSSADYQVTIIDIIRNINTALRGLCPAI